MISMSSTPKHSAVELCSTFSQLLLTFSPLFPLIGVHKTPRSAVYISSETLILLSVAFLFRYHYVYPTLFSFQYLLEKLHLTLLLVATYYTHRTQSRLHIPSQSEPLLSNPDVEDQQDPTTEKKIGSFPFHSLAVIPVLTASLAFSLFTGFAFSFYTPTPPETLGHVLTSTTIETVCFGFQYIHILNLLGTGSKQHLEAHPLRPTHSDQEYITRLQISPFLSAWMLAVQAGFAARLPEMAARLMRDDASAQDWMVGSLEVSTVGHFGVFLGFVWFAPKHRRRVGRD